MTCENGNAVEVVDARAHRVIHTIKMPSDTLRPMGVVAAPDSSRVFVSTGRGRQVVVIDVATNQVLGATGRLK